MNPTQEMIDARDKMIADLKKTIVSMDKLTDVLMTDKDKLKVALQACVELMEQLPTLNGMSGLAGLAVLENAKDVLK